MHVVGVFGPVGVPVIVFRLMGLRVRRIVLRHALVMVSSESLELMCSNCAKEAG